MNKVQDECLFPELEQFLTNTYIPSNPANSTEAQLATDNSQTHNSFQTMEKQNPIHGTLTFRDLLSPQGTLYPHESNQYFQSQYYHAYNYPQTHDYGTAANEYELHLNANDELHSNGGVSPTTLLPSTQWMNNFQNMKIAEYPIGMVPVVKQENKVGPEIKKCDHCGSDTSFWTIFHGYVICNRCHYRNVNPGTVFQTKPKRMAVAKQAGRKCANCQTEKTSLWRRNDEGEHVCNSCGLYFKMHGRTRPPSMKKDTIQRRKRKPKNPNTSIAPISQCVTIQPVQSVSSTTMYNEYNSGNLRPATMPAVPITEGYDINAVCNNTQVMSAPPPPPYRPPLAPQPTLPLPVQYDDCINYTSINYNS